MKVRWVRHLSGRGAARRSALTNPSRATGGQGPARLARRFTFRRQLSPYVLILGLTAALATAVLVVIFSYRAHDERTLAHGLTVRVFNKVFIDERHVSENAPAYLSAAPINYCELLGCALPGERYRTGIEVRAVCLIFGESVRNDFGGDAHAGGFMSNIWFLIRSDLGSMGFLSNVWIDPAQRDLLLPLCSAALTAKTAEQRTLSALGD